MRICPGLDSRCLRYCSIAVKRSYGQGNLRKKLLSGGLITVSKDALHLQPSWWSVKAGRHGAEGVMRAFIYKWEVEEEEGWMSLGF